MAEKTKDELEIENAFFKHTEEERKYMESRFAIKLVEKIVFTLVGLVALGVIGALINLVVKQ